MIFDGTFEWTNDPDAPVGGGGGDDGAVRWRRIQYVLIFLSGAAQWLYV